MARAFYRKLIDKNGNTYCIEIPPDVDPENIEDILVGIHDRIVKLNAYCLAGDVYRAPDNVELAQGGKEYTFYKKINVFESYPELNQEDFSTALQELLDNARNFRINRAEITHFEGKPVKKDNRGYYLEREVECVAEGCSEKIKGEQRLSMADGVISRAQSFVPYSKDAQRARPGSKQWLCPNCAAKSIPVPEHLQPRIETPQIDDTQQNQEVKKEKPVKQVKTSSSKLEAMLEMTKQDDVNSEYFKGYVRGVLESLIQGD